MIKSNKPISTPRTARVPTSVVLRERILSQQRSVHSPTSSQPKTKKEGLTVSQPSVPPPPPSSSSGASSPSKSQPINTSREGGQPSSSSHPSASQRDTFLPLSSGASRSTGSPATLHHVAYHRLLGLGWTLRWCIEEDPSSSSSATNDGNTVLQGGSNGASQGCPLCRASLSSQGSSSSSPTGRYRERHYQHLVEWVTRASLEDTSTTTESSLSAAQRRLLPFLFNETLLDYYASLGLNNGESRLSGVAVLSPQVQDASAVEEVPLSFFMLPPLSSVEAISEEETKDILSQCSPSLFSSSETSNEIPHRSLFRYLPQRELNAKRRQQSRTVHAATYGDVSAVEIYLLLEEKRDKKTSLDTASSSSLSVWGRRKRKHPTESRRGSTSTAEDGVSPAPSLFYLASRVEDYFRLGAAFGWVYGWQLCYHRDGPPVGSLPWLKWVNRPGVLAAIKSIQSPG